MSIIPVELQQSRIIGVPRDSLPTVRRALGANAPVGGDLRATAIATIADRAVARYCAVRRSHPGLWANPVDGAFNALLNNAPNILAEELCRPYDNESPGTGSPQSQIVGGQCAVNYVVSASGTVQNGQTFSQQTTLPGPIRSVRLDVVTQGGFRLWNLVVIYGPASLTSTLQLISSASNSPSGFLATWQYSLARQDGQPDNCGNGPPIALPPAPPAWNTTTNINIGPQSISVPISIGGGDVANYPDFNFDPTVTIDGSVDVRVGPVDIQLVFPAPIAGVPDSIFRDLNPNINLAPALEILSNNQIQIDAGIEIIQGEIVDGIPVDLDPVLQLIRACCCSPSYVYSQSLVVASTRGGIFDLPEGTVAVLVSQTVNPVRSPMASGEGFVPDARWEGWISFGRDGKPGTRSQIQWRDGGYPVPQDSNCVLIFGLYNSSYSITAVIKTRELPP